MYLYISGSGNRRRELDPRLPAGLRHVLLSCHKEYRSVAHTLSRSLLDCGQPFELMYDSGAFTAWTKGHEVTLDSLIPIYDEMMDAYSPFARNVWLLNLDKIPGQKGILPTGDDITEALRISDKNFDVLTNRYGPRVLPVYHMTESEARLQEVAKMANYIALSPRFDQPETIRRDWARQAAQQVPDNRLHGLASTGYYMMTMVPWHSVDSISARAFAAFGTVLMPPKMYALAISEHRGTVKEQGKHFRTLSPGEKEWATFEFSKRGFTSTELETDDNSRTSWNRIIMLEVIEKKTHSYPPIQQTLFGI